MLVYTGYLSTMIGILTPLLMTPTPGQWIQRMRDWSSEQNRTPVEESINTSILELEMDEHGCDDTTESEELLQLQGDGD